MIAGALVMDADGQRLVGVGDGRHVADDEHCGACRVHASRLSMQTNEVTDLPVLRSRRDHAEITPRSRRDGTSDRREEDGEIGSRDEITPRSRRDGTSDRREED